MARGFAATGLTVLTVVFLLLGPMAWSAAIAQSASADSSDTLTDAQIRAELRRLQAVRTQCLAQAQQALAQQRSANAGGQLAQAETYGRTLTEKMECVDHVNQDLGRLQVKAGPAKAALFNAEDRFHQEYRQSLLGQLGTLQAVIAELSAPETLTYDAFFAQMEALRRQTDTFRNRFIRLLNETETQELAKTVFQASDALVGSAQSWRDQVRAEHDLAALTPNGASAQVTRNTAARDAAQKQRLAQWDTARQLVQRATLMVASGEQSR